jgi:nitroreductase
MGILSGRPATPPSLADNALLRAVLDRRSVRSFDERPIPDEVMAAILEAARVAPSTVNLQTWSFAVYSADGWREAFGHTIPFRAQAAVIVLADTHRARAVLDAFPESPLIEYTVGVMNASLAAMNMNIAAEALGVSSVMLSETGRTGLLDAGYLAQALALPPRVVPLMTIVFGYPRRGRPPMPPRLPLEAITFTGSYQEADPSVMQGWLNEMQAGYRAANRGATLDGQIGVYLARIGQAEEDLRRIVYRTAGDPTSETDLLV